ISAILWSVWSEGPGLNPVRPPGGSYLCAVWAALIPCAGRWLRPTHTRADERRRSNPQDSSAMANNIITISMITREAIEIFVNSTAFIKNIDRQFDDEFGRSGAKIGSQLRIRLPNDFVVASGPGVSVQDTAEQQTVLTMSTQQHVDVSFSQA